MAIQNDYLHSGKHLFSVVEGKSLGTISTEEVTTLSPDASSDTRNGDSTYLLAVSPYTERAHLLDLRSVNVENAILAQALVQMKCLRPDYATAPYVECFNWDEVIDEVRRLAQQQGHVWRASSFFVVAFRSVIPPTTVYADLGALDKAAHAEATASGGFLKYWFGSPDTEGRNLATCVWRSQEDARRAGVGPAHRRAAGSARDLYSDWRIDRHRLIIGDKVESWDIRNWS